MQAKYAVVMSLEQIEATLREAAEHIRKLTEVMGAKDGKAQG